jgi:hypothetical protein
MVERGTCRLTPATPDFAALNQDDVAALVSVRPSLDR